MTISYVYDVVQSRTMIVWDTIFVKKKWGLNPQIFAAYACGFYVNPDFMITTMMNRIDVMRTS